MKCPWKRCFTCQTHRPESKFSTAAPCIVIMESLVLFNNSINSLDILWILFATQKHAYCLINIVTDSESLAFSGGGLMQPASSLT